MFQIIPASLEVLNCHSNKLLNLDVSNNPVMMILYCGSNQIGSLDISANAGYWYCGFRIRCS